MEVEQLGEAKVMVFGTTFSTEVKVLEDDSDPQHLRTHFELKRSVSPLHICNMCPDMTPSKPRVHAPLHACEPAS